MADVDNQIISPGPNAIIQINYTDPNTKLGISDVIDVRIELSVNPPDVTPLARIRGELTGKYTFENNRKTIEFEDWPGAHNGDEVSTFPEIRIKNQDASREAFSLLITTWDNSHSNNKFTSHRTFTNIQLIERS